MAQLTPARDVARKLVSSRRRRSAYIRDLIRNSTLIDALSEQDRAFATRLTMGVCAASATLDSLIQGHLSGKSHLEPRVKDALEVSAYELCYLSTPASAAVSQGVELMRSVNPRLCGLANAVLHRIADIDVARVRSAQEALLQGTYTKDEFALAAAVPSWLAERLMSSLGTHEAAVYGASIMDAPEVYVVLNGIDEDAPELAALQLEHGPFEGIYHVGSAAALGSSGLVEDVRVIPADLSAHMISRIAAPRNAESLLELGQGRATKTLLMACASHALTITSIDNDEKKVARASRRLTRSGLPTAFFQLAFDGTNLASPKLPPELNKQFDRVFVDAPCSGTGTMRRHVEISSTLNQQDLLSLTQLQQQLLTAASQRVAQNGVLIYSSCSALVEENEQQIDAFLSSELGSCFELEPLSLKEHPFLEGNLTDKGYFRTCFSRRKADIHFAAVLKRVR